MRPAKRLQTIHVKDEQGRIVSSWQRVRVPVPDGISASLPPPYTGLEAPHEDGSDRGRIRRNEGAVPGRDRRGWRVGTIYRELGDLDRQGFDEIMRRGPAPYRVFAKLDRKHDEIFGIPAWKDQPQAEPVYFDVMRCRDCRSHSSRYRA